MKASPHPRGNPSARALVRRLRTELRHMVRLDHPLEGRDARAKGHIEMARHINTWLEVRGYGHSKL